MNNYRFAMVIPLLALLCSAVAARSEVVELPFDPSLHMTWIGAEKTYYSPQWRTQVVSNVSVPTIEIFRPEPGIGNGTGVVIAPGGALYALSISSEGEQVARWLNGKGFTAFVLRYRLLPTGDDAVAEAAAAGASITSTVAPVLPLSIADGLAAVNYVRSNAAALGVAENKIGFMGFSAGGAVTMGVTLSSNKDSRPDFIVPVYPWMSVLGDYKVPSEAPPMLVVCASDDPLGIAKDSVSLYQRWLEAGVSVALHMYSKGGHGFGMRKNGLASDHWIERFHDWAITEGIVE